MQSIEVNGKHIHFLSYNYFSPIWSGLLLQLDHFLKIRLFLFISVAWPDSAAHVILCAYWEIKQSKPYLSPQADLCDVNRCIRDFPITSTVSIISIVCSYPKISFKFNEITLLVISDHFCTINIGLSYLHI